MEIGSNSATVGAPSGGPLAGSVTLPIGSTFNLNGFAVSVTALYGGSPGGLQGGTVTSSNAASLYVDTSGLFTALNPDMFFGYISGAINLFKVGVGVLLLDNIFPGASSGNSYTGGTNILNGTLKLGYAYGISGAPLTVDAPGELDMNGFSPTVSSLSGNGSSSYSQADDAVITNSAPIMPNNPGASVSVLTVSGNGTTQTTYGGRIVDGASPVGLFLEYYHYQTGLTLTNSENNYSGGTSLNDANLTYAYPAGTTITGNIDSTDEDVVSVYVAGGTSETFAGSITAGDCQLVKLGAGTLYLDPSRPDTYDGTIVDDGTLTLGNTNAIFAGTGITVTGGAVLDLGGLTDMPGVGDVSLADGEIVNGTLNIAPPAIASPANTLTVQYGEITANVAGDASLVMAGLSGSYTTVAGVPANTVVINGDCSQLTAQADVKSGTLVVNGPMGTSNVLVDGSGAVLEGSGNCTGLVEVDKYGDGGTLALGGSNASFTMGTLTLYNGAVVSDDDAGPQDAYLASVTGALSINSGVTVGYATGGTPYQVLFNYGSLGNADSFANLSGSNSTVPLVNNTFASSIDISQAPVLDWAGGTGTWNSTLQNWVPAGGTVAQQWVSGDAAVFAESGTWTATLGFTPTVTAIVFEASGGTLDLGGNSVVVGGGLVMLAGGTIQHGTLKAESYLAEQGTVSATLADYSSSLSAPLTVASNTGAYPVVLTAANTFSGGITIEPGATLQLGDGTTGDDGTIAAGAGIVDYGTLQFDISSSKTSNAPYVFSNNISGSGGTLTAYGSGVVELTGTNTYGGGTVVLSGTLVVASAAGLQSGSSLTVGQDAVGMFAPASPSGADFAGRWGMDDGDSSGSGSDSGSGGDSDSGGDTFAQTRQMLAERAAAANAAFLAFENAIAPSSNPLNWASADTNVRQLYVQVFFAVAVPDLTLTSREAAILQVVESEPFDMTAVPNGDSYTPIGNTSNDQVVAWNDSIDHFFSSYSVTS